MDLIKGLLVFFGGATALAFAYQLYRRRPITVALHYAVIFGLFVMIVVYVLAIALDLLDITPEPPAPVEPAKTE
ncbi:MAG: hypothetical protein MRY74_06315 [Neomegalonema sp.]|nr:hypothetical protein [Neomegalonema sp.]